MSMNQPTLRAVQEETTHKKEFSSQWPTAVGAKPSRLMQSNLFQPAIIE